MQDNEVSDCTEPSGKRQIKFSSFNVENIASKLSETDFVSYIKSFDIFCALEIFSNTQFDFSIHFPEFHSPAVKLSRHGRRSGGVVLVKKYIMPFVSHVECKYDNIVCIKISKDLVGLDKDL